MLLLLLAINDIANVAIEGIAYLDEDFHANRLILAEFCKCIRPDACKFTEPAFLHATVNHTLPQLIVAYYHYKLSAPSKKLYLVYQ